MNSKARALMALQVLCCLTMTVGVGAIIYGLLHHHTIPLFMFDVPLWVIGASALYMGVKYYRRLPEMESKLQVSSGFAWKNFSPRNWR